MGGGRNLHDIGLENLRFGIVEQAVDDYLSLLAGFIVPTTNCNLAELERFFYSDWFSVLCKLEPEFIIENLKRKAKKMILKYTVSKQKGSSRYYVHEVGSKEPIPGTLANSCSTMHKIQAKEFVLSDFSTEHLSATNLIVFSMVIDAMNNARLDFLQRKDKKDWWQMIQMLPTCYNQKRTVQLNYAVLKNMYHSRQNHKLDEWRELCKWVETLPYSQLITG